MGLLSKYKVDVSPLIGVRSMQNQKTSHRRGISQISFSPVLNAVQF